MNKISKKIKGYVYILEVKDIDLPVCKIGMTSRNPYDRCSEINNSSTGDFIWEVVHYVAVDNCRKLESLVHKKLKPLRQKNREFFNINAEVAHNALLSIVKNQSKIKEIPVTEIKDSQEIATEEKRRRSKHMPSFRKIDADYAELLQAFTSLIGVKGRPFGQLNKPLFGMSDGNEGVQWNIAVFTDTDKIRLGVNLEGMKYSNWPISAFILSELENPSINQLKVQLKHPEKVYIQFMRDAWQVTSRPEIVEKYFGGKEFSILEMDDGIWTSVLTEALRCLNEEKGYQGRNKQMVTLANEPKKGERTREMEVSPHLWICTPIDLSEDVTPNLEIGIEQLKSVFEWVSRVSS